MRPLPPGVLRKDVILSGLQHYISQGCDSRAFRFAGAHPVIPYNSRFQLLMKMEKDGLISQSFE